MDILEAIKKAQNGSTEAFGQIYEEFADRIFRFIKLKVGNQQQAEDLLQESFIKAWQGLGHLKLDNNLNLSAWLFTISANTVNDHFRKIYRRPQTVELTDKIDFSSAENINERLAVNEDVEIVKLAMRQLPIQYQQILELRFVQDFTIGETAKILQKNNLGVRVIQHRALKRLREIMKNTYDLGYEKI